MKIVYVLFLYLSSFSANFGLEKIDNGFAKKRDDPKTLEVSVIDSETAIYLFKEFVKNKSIPFKFPRDGCFARATAMAMIAEKSSVIMGKAYVTGHLVVKTDIPKFPIVMWGWHVAPVSFVKKIDGTIELMVFDPILFSQPASIDEWLKKMKVDIGIKGAEGRVDEVYYGSRFQYLQRSDKTEEYKKTWMQENLEDMRIKFLEHFKLQEILFSESLLAVDMVFSNYASASKLKDNNGKYQTQSMTLTESLEKIVETEKEFLILFSRHAAFYRFPKKSESTSDIRLYFKKLIKSKKRITVEIDPVSTEIKIIKDK